MSEIAPPLTDVELAEIEARANAATPGPWELCQSETHCHVVYPDDTHVGGVDGEHWWPADAEFVAHARTDIPRLLAEVRALRKELARTGHLVAAALRWADLWPFVPGPGNDEEAREDALLACEQTLFDAVCAYLEAQSGQGRE